MLDKNKEFPDFVLKNQDGETRSLKNYSGQWLVIFFYSKDDTFGCTKEVIDFNKHAQDFANLGAKIIGISGDSVRTHQKFAQKTSLAYEILSDPERTFIESIGLLKDRQMYGKPVKGVNRSTFLLDPKGIIKEYWSSVKVTGHAAEVLTALEFLSKQ